MKRDLTEIFLEAAREVNSRTYWGSCLAVARAAGCSDAIGTSWRTYPEAAFYYEATSLSRRQDYALWSLPTREQKAIRVLLLCLMAAAWRDLPRGKYGL